MGCAWRPESEHFHHYLSLPFLCCWIQEEGRGIGGATAASFTYWALEPHKSKGSGQTLPQSFGDLRAHCLHGTPAGACSDCISLAQPKRGGRNYPPLIPFLDPLMGRSCRQFGLPQTEGSLRTTAAIYTAKKYFQQFPFFCFLHLYSFYLLERPLRLSNFSFSKTLPSALANISYIHSKGPWSGLPGLGKACFSSGG